MVPTGPFGQGRISGNGILVQKNFTDKPRCGAVCPRSMRLGSCENTACAQRVLQKVRGSRRHQNETGHPGRQAEPFWQTRSSMTAAFAPPVTRHPDAPAREAKMQKTSGCLTLRRVPRLFEAVFACALRPQSFYRDKALSGNSPAMFPAPAYL